jgi:hypothetical protein
MAAELQMISKSGFRSAFCRTPLVFALITVLGVSGLFLRNTVLDTPIYASDEYAYLIAGKFFDHRPALSQDDPGLQVIPNVLYFRIIHGAFQLTQNGWETLRALNIFLYALIGLAFTAVANRLTSRAVAAGFLLLYFLLPWSGYTASVQPEIVAYFAICLVAFTAIAAVRWSSLLLCIGAGLLAAGSYYIKPSIVGIAISTALFLLLYFGDNQSQRRRWLLRGLACSAFLVSLYGGLLIWRCVAGETWAWIPDFMSGHYGYELRQSTGGGWATAVSCLAYCAGHVTVLLMMFPFGITAIVRTIRAGSIDSTGEGENSWLSLTLARWIVLALFASLVVVSYYSSKTAGISDFGARLHGRYLGFALPFLLLFSMLFVHGMFARDDRLQVNHRWIRLSSLLLFSGLLLWELFTEGYFRVYPWDYPELTALFSSQNKYWHEPALWSTRFIVLCLAFVTASVFLTGKKFTKYFALGYIAIWLIIANRNNTAFQVVTSRNFGELTVEARNLTMLAQLDHRRGMVIGADRWGPLSYVLFGIASDVVVRPRPYGSTITAQDVCPGCEWILCEGEYVPQFKFQAVLTTAKLKLFLLNRGAGYPIGQDKTEQ